jgi:flagellar biosynthesis/type III secretory pathway protein FliH
MAQGLEKGLEKGMEKGMEKGLQRGREQGRLDTLTRQLTRRFGPLPDAALARLQSATPDQLDLWTDRVLDAPTLEAVLGGH